MSPSGSTSSAPGSSLSSCLGSTLTGGTVPEALPAASWPGGASSGEVVPCGGPVPDSICDLAPEGPDHRVDRLARSSRDLCQITSLQDHCVVQANRVGCYLFEELPCQNQVHMVGVIHAGLAQLHKVGVDHFGKVSSLMRHLALPCLSFSALVSSCFTLDSRRLLMAGDMLANAPILSAQTEERSQGQRSQTGGLEA